MTTTTTLRRRSRPRRRYFRFVCVCACVVGYLIFFRVRMPPHIHINMSTDTRSHCANMCCADHDLCTGCPKYSDHNVTLGAMLCPHRLSELLCFALSLFTP